jgi:hypothetical protein
MFRKLLLLVLLLVATHSMAQGLTLTVNGSYRASITAQGIPGQPVVLIINFNQPGAITDTVFTDSLGNFSRIYSIPTGWTSGIVLAQSLCGNGFAVDSSGWFPRSICFAPEAPLHQPLDLSVAAFHPLPPATLPSLNCFA